jgi:hypothetical protein
MCSAPTVGAGDEGDDAAGDELAARDDRDEPDLGMTAGDAAPDRPVPSAGRGFRPPSRRRARIAAGTAIAAAAVGGNVLIYTSLDDTTEVLQLTRDVRAGEVVTADALRIVDVDLDPTVPVVSADRIALVVNQYARVHLAAGSLIVDVLVQPNPLVSPGTSVVAVQLRGAAVPFGLRSRSRVQVVVPQGNGVEPYVAEGRVVNAGDRAAGPDELVAMSVELAPDAAVKVAAAPDVSVILLDPATDPALEEAG